MPDHLLLLDASGFAYRAYHTGGNQFRSDGLPTYAITGFMALVWRLLGAAQADRPTHSAAVFDAPGRTFRHKMFAAYKKNRPARDMELEVQLPYMRHAAEALGLTPVECAGYEGDDVLATLATQARAIGMRVSIVSSDKDCCQLVDDDWIQIIEPVTHTRIGVAEVIKKFGVPPAQVADVQALAGDAIDGIPGIAGCGLSRAAALVRRFGNVAGVLANAKECRWPQVRTQLKRHGKDARLYLKLTTLRRDVPLDVAPDALKLSPIMKSHLIEILKALEASPRMEALFALDPKMTRPVEHVDDIHSWHAEELAASGQRVPDLPQCGFYQRRLVKGGVFVPARIWREPEIDPETGMATGRDVLRCEVGGRARDPFAEWTRLAMAPIKESAFNYEVADSDHAKKYRPDSPKATPEKPIDILAAKAPHNPSKTRRRA